MSKCKKTKNPCKICLGSVSHKTGIQCQGACECWVHYSCLNYTPGKIKDIKAGIIRINCPCPDCKTTLLPKEERVNEPYSCTNIGCPANQPPRCENVNCPMNDESPDKMNQTSGRGPLPPQALPPHALPPHALPPHALPPHAFPPHALPPRGMPHGVPGPIPLVACGQDCKKHSFPNVPGSPGPFASQIGVELGIAPYAQTQSPAGSTCIPKCTSSCSSNGDVPGDFGQSAVQGMPSIRAFEQMCQTVGQLTNQLNCLMTKMRQVVQDSNAGGRGAGPPKPCPHKGKSVCPKPCFCPGNPRKN